MANQLSPYERVRQYFESSSPGNTEQKNVGEIWAKASDTERLGLIAKAAPQLMIEGETLDSFLNSVQRDMPTFAPERSFDQQGQPQQAGPGILGNLVKGFTDREESATAGSPGSARIDRATQAIHSIQEEKLLKEFDEVLKMEDSPARTNAIRNLLDKRLEAPSLFGDQIDILREHVWDTGGVGEQYQGVDRQKAKEEMAADLLKKAKARQEKIAAYDNTPEGARAKAARDAKEKELHDRVLSERDPRAARDAFQNLARRRIAETTRQYYVLEGYTNTQGDDFFAQIGEGFLRERMFGRAQRARARQQESEGHADEGLSTEHTQAANATRQQQGQQPGGNRFLNYVRNAGKGEAKSLARQGFKKLLKNAAKKALEKAAQAILTQPEILIPIIVAVGIIFLIILVIITIIAIVMSLSGQNFNDNNTTPIPGLTLTLNTNPAGKTSYQNGQNIAFVIDATYAGPYSLVVVDQTADNATVIPSSVTGKADQSNNAVSWNLDVNKPLPDSTSSEKHWQFYLTFSQIGNDSVFHNTVTAQYAPGSGLSNSPPPSAKPQAGGSCSPDTLQKYFGSADAAATASCICKYESGADPGLVNKACTKGETADWSVGLFQINLDTNPQRCAGAFSQTGLSCKIANTTSLNACTGNLTDPTNNINAAVAIYHASHNTWDSGWKAEKGKCF